MNIKQMRSADILASIVLTAISTYVLIYSVGLMNENPDPQGRFYASAGFIPMVISALLLLMNLWVLVNGFRSGGSLRMFAPAKIRESLKTEVVKNTMFIFLWIAFYILIMLQYLPYFFSTFIFLTVFIKKFYTRRLLVIMAISFAITSLVTFCFGYIVRMPLPGI